MKLRSVGVLAVLGILGAWLVAAAGIGVDVPATPRQGPGPALQPDPIVARIEAQSAHLHNYLSGAPPLRPPTRDPFRFGSRPSPATTADRPAPRLAEPAVAAAAEPLPLALVGVAEDGAGEKTARVAVISGMGQLFLVKEGEEFGGRFRVVRIGPDAASVTDTVMGKTGTLALK
jgi:hypothetical protein